MRDGFGDIVWEGAGGQNWMREVIFYQNSCYKMIEKST